MRDDVYMKVDQLRNEGVKFVKLAFTDIDGIHRGKYVSLDKFAHILDDGGGFCDCVLGWDSNDQLYDNVSFTGWHTGFPDARYRVDVDSERFLPDEANTPLYLLDFTQADGSPHPLCPRSVLKKVLGRAASAGFGVNLAFEYEFFLFDETPESVREKGYKNLKPLTPGNFGYSILRNSTYSDLFHEFLEFCEGMQFPVEGLHCETGPGVWEAALHYTDALEMADSAALFKTFSKAFFQKREIMATFMAKWSMDHPGQSGHMHQSLYGRQSGRNAFFQEDADSQMSVHLHHYLGGQQKYLRGLLPMYAPTINSYTRLVKGYWAPTTSCWGTENRTTALRLIGECEKSMRIEFRLGSADANPYLAAAAAIGSGLLGMERNLHPSEGVKGSAYEADVPEEMQLADNLADAVRDFRGSPEAVELFGQEFVDHFASSREWEVREYQKQVTDWQLQRYFEII